MPDRMTDMNSSQWPSQFRAALGIMHGNRGFGAPVQVNLRLTNRCNLRCIHCFFYSPFLEKPNLVVLRKARHEDQELPGRTDLQEMQKMSADPDRLLPLIDNLLSLGVRRWQLGGNGEPFVYRHVLDVIRRVKRKNSYCLANTNGTLLDPDTVDELIRLGFDDLRITTLAGTEETYQKMHPGVAGSTFMRLTDALLAFARKKSERTIKRPRVTLVFILLAQNICDIYSFAEYAVRVKVDRVLYRPVDDVGDPNLAALIPTEEQAVRIRQELDRAEKYLHSKGIPHNIDQVRKVLRRKLDTKTFYRVVPCYYGWLVAIIEPDGSILPCCRCYTSFGNVFDTDFRAIWNNKFYRRYREEALSINKRGTPVTGCDCYSCVHYPANLRVFRILHPFRTRFSRLNNLKQCVE